MFYEPAKGNHGLPNDPFKALVTPRPIGWIGTYGPTGIPNLAPYSYFNAVSSIPPIVCFSSDGYKDSVTNVDHTGAFSCSVAIYELKDAMNATSAAVPHDVNEFELAGLTEKRCRLVNAPSVAESPVVLECRHLETRNLVDIDGNKTTSFVVFGQVVGIHIDERVIRDGKVDPRLLRPLARMGYMDYLVGDQPFTLNRP